MNFAELEELVSVPKVLVVEDEAESQWIIASTLQSVKGNADLKWVKSAEEAEILLKTGEHYDLIIADHYLKGEETGLDLWKSCHKKYRSIPFMMTSALTDKVFARLVGSQLPRPLFLHKPIDVKECRSMMEWFLDGPRYVGPVDLLEVEADEEPGGSWLIGFAILAIISALVTSSKTDFPVTHKQESGVVRWSLPQDTKPLRFVIPVFPGLPHKVISDRSKKNSSSLIKKIITNELKNKVNEITERGRIILMEEPKMLDLPKLHNEIYEGTDGTFDKEFEKFKIIRACG